MWNDATLIIKNLYGIKVKPDSKYKAKLASAIEYLGDKYLLSKPVQRLN